MATNEEVPVLDELFERWDGESAHVAFEPELGAWMFICVHSTERGPATGGIRMRTYPSPEDALRDGLRLSSAMTLKMAICDAPLGGGKSVIAVPESLDPGARRAVLERFAHHLSTLKGTYYGAPDMNTSSEDMDLIHERAPFVFCRSAERGGSGSTAPGTALGVLHGILASAPTRGDRRTFAAVGSSSRGSAASEGTWSRCCWSGGPG